MKRAITCALALFAFLAAAAFADDGGTAAWLDGQPAAQAYAASADEIVQVIDQASKAGVPVDLLSAKVKEGVSKRVPPQVLVAALREEADRLAVGSSLLDDHEGIVDPSAREKAVRRIGLLLAGGTSVSTVQALMDAASRAQRGSSAVVEALGVLAQVTLSLQLTDPLVRTLGTSLLRSRMREEVFSSVLPVLMRARAVGLSADAAVAMVSGVMDTGGGLIQMQEQIDQKSAGRSTQAGLGAVGQGQARGNGTSGRAGQPGASSNGGSAGGGGSPNGNGSGATGSPAHR